MCLLNVDIFIRDCFFGPVYLDRATFTIAIIKIKVPYTTLYCAAAVFSLEIKTWAGGAVGARGGPPSEAAHL